MSGCAFLRWLLSLSLRQEASWILDSVQDSSEALLLKDPSKELLVKDPSRELLLKEPFN